MSKKYIVRLSSDERCQLEGLVSKGKVAAYKRLHAQILLKADISEGPGWIDQKISEAFDVTVQTVENVRKRLVEEGLDAACGRAKRSRVKSRKLDGEQEAYLVALTCSEPPTGESRPRLRLLADQMVELNYVDKVSHETIRTTLKKNEIKPWQKKEWCIPPEENAEFVCAMEVTKEVYKRPYDPMNPVVCMDESSKQQIKEVRETIKAKKGKPERYDTSSERNGVSNIFIFFEPLRGWRHIEITDQRTAIDWAKQIQSLVDQHYSEANKITLVMDNLNTHVGASLYKAFPPKEARRILNKLDIHYTPKHGSWLNMAEIELSILSRQCLDRRIPDQKTLKTFVMAWLKKRNNHSLPMNWRFTTEDARIKLERLYPKINI